MLVEEMKKCSCNENLCLTGKQQSPILIDANRLVRQSEGKKIFKLIGFNNEEQSHYRILNFLPTERQLRQINNCAISRHFINISSMECIQLFFFCKENDNISHKVSFIDYLLINLSITTFVQILVNLLFSISVDLQKLKIANNTQKQ